MGKKYTKSGSVKLQTKSWGTLEIDIEEIITFPRGIPGFEDVRRFAIFENREIHPFKWLICVDQPDLGFVIISPHLLDSDYNPKLYESDLQELQVAPTDRLTLFAIVTLTPDPLKSTANLQGPLLINLSKKTGKQIVVVDEEYSVKYPILHTDRKNKTKKECAAVEY